MQDVDRRSELTDNTLESETINSLVDNTLEIFLNLSVGRVHYKSVTRSLYYVDSLEIPVSEMIRNVFKGFNQIPDIQQCYLDKHSFFKGAFCVKLNKIQSQPVLVALRLQGIQIKITQ